MNIRLPPSPPALWGGLWRFPFSLSFPTGKPLIFCPNPRQPLRCLDSTLDFLSIILCQVHERSWERHQKLCGGNIITWMLWLLCGQILQRKTFPSAGGSNLQAKSLLALTSWGCVRLALKLEVWTLKGPTRWWGGWVPCWRKALLSPPSEEKQGLGMRSSGLQSYANPPLPYYSAAPCTHTHPINMHS